MTPTPTPELVELLKEAEKQAKIKVINYPDKIYLNAGYDMIPPSDLDENGMLDFDTMDHEFTTWAQDSIEENDPCYVHISALTELAALKDKEWQGKLAKQIADHHADIIETERDLTAKLTTAEAECERLRDEVTPILLDCRNTIRQCESVSIGKTMLNVMEMKIENKIREINPDFYFNIMNGLTPSK